MDFRFDDATTALMDEARLCAIDLGSQYISTVHLLLADCKGDNHQSIKDFIFQTPEKFQSIYNSQRVGESDFFDSVLVSLPITIEMENTIRFANKIYNEKIRPHHLFLAASELKTTLFYSILEPKDGLHEALIDFYSQKGIVVSRKPKKKNFWQLLNRKLQFE
jgi:hypothetical protein